jgi:protein-disulfide isomerase
MKNDKSWVFGLIVIAAIVGLSVWGFNRNNNEQVKPTVLGESTDNEEYFSEDATVMYFYSDYCSWCLKQKEVLKTLASEGYRVKPMNVGKNQSLWETYSIKGTPTFVAKNGDRVEGYKEANDLKKWLDEHK